MDEIIQPLENRKLKWSPDILYNFRNLAKARLRDGHHKFKKLHHVLATHKKLPNLLYSLGGCRLEKAVHTYNFLSSPHFLINDTMRKLKEPFMKLPFFRKLFFLIALQYLLHSTMKNFSSLCELFPEAEMNDFKSFSANVPFVFFPLWIKSPFMERHFFLRMCSAQFYTFILRNLSHLFTVLFSIIFTSFSFLNYLANTAGVCTSIHQI